MFRLISSRLVLLDRDIEKNRKIESNVIFAPNRYVAPFLKRKELRKVISIYINVEFMSGLIYFNGIRLLLHSQIDNCNNINTISI